MFYTFWIESRRKKEGAFQNVILHSRFGYLGSQKRAVGSNILLEVLSAQYLISMVPTVFVNSDYLPQDHSVGPLAVFALKGLLKETCIIRPCLC